MPQASAILIIGYFTGFVKGKIVEILLNFEEDGPPGARTPNLALSRCLLFPIELAARISLSTIKSVDYQHIV